MPSRTKSGPGQCPKCDRLYADLLEHINKKHGNDHFTPEDLVGRDLVVCVCGRVVLNKAGLLKHQQRFGCLGSVDRTPQRLHSQAGSRIGRTIGDTSSLSSLPASHITHPTATSSLTTLSSALSSLPAASLVHDFNTDLNVWDDAGQGVDGDITADSPDLPLNPTPAPPSHSPSLDNELDDQNAEVTGVSSHMHVN